MIASPISGSWTIVPANVSWDEIVRCLERCRLDDFGLRHEEVCLSFTPCYVFALLSRRADSPMWCRTEMAPVLQASSWLHRLLTHCNRITPVFHQLRPWVYLRGRAVPSRKSTGSRQMMRRLALGDGHATLDLPLAVSSCRNLSARGRRCFQFDDQRVLDDDPQGQARCAFRSSLHRTQFC